MNKQAVVSFLWLVGKVVLAVAVARTAANFVPVVGPMVNNAMDKGLLGNKS